MTIMIYINSLLLFIRLLTVMREPFTFCHFHIGKCGLEGRILGAAGIDAKGYLTAALVIITIFSGVIEKPRGSLVQYRLFISNVIILLLMAKVRFCQVFRWF